MTERRSQTGLAMAGTVIVAGGIGIAVVEWLRLPKGSIWLVIGTTVLVVALIRTLTARRGDRSDR